MQKKEEKTMAKYKFFEEVNHSLDYFTYCRTIEQLKKAFYIKNGEIKTRANPDIKSILYYLDSFLEDKELALKLKERYPKFYDTYVNHTTTLTMCEAQILLNGAIALDENIFNALKELIYFDVLLRKPTKQNRNEILIFTQSENAPEVLEASAKECARQILPIIVDLLKEISTRKSEGFSIALAELINVAKGYVAIPNVPTNKFRFLVLAQLLLELECVDYAIFVEILDYDIVLSVKDFD